MKYIRNSRKKTKPVKQKKELQVKNTDGMTEQEKLTYQEELRIGKKLLEDAQWVADLSNVKQFSFEWVHTVLVELLFQCMGKKEIIQGYTGKEHTLRIFKEKPALEIVAMIAKMNGHLFDVVKGSINKTVQGTVEHQHQIELKPDASRTVKVFEILESCGVFESRTKQLSHSEVEQVYTA